VPATFTRRCCSPSALAISLRDPNTACVDVSTTSEPSSAIQAVQTCGSR
jgi:hypothetical protein